MTRSLDQTRSDQTTTVHSSPLQSTPVHSSPLQSTSVHISPLKSNLCQFSLVSEKKIIRGWRRAVWGVGVNCGCLAAVVSAVHEVGDCIPTLQTLYKSESLSGGFRHTRYLSPAPPQPNKGDFSYPEYGPFYLATRWR